MQPNPRSATPIIVFAIGMAASLLLGACALPVQPISAPAEAPAATGKNAAHPQGWTDESHGNKVEPNYDVVFPVDAVNVITITMTPDDWTAMQADIADINARMAPVRDAIIAAGADLSLAERQALLPQIMAEVFASAASPATPEVSDTAELTTTAAVTETDASNRSPIWVPATITFNGQNWNHVGVRYKGMSSMGTWVLGDLHLPFKFDFDQFEDEYPEIKNQRFFGFKQLSLANNFKDPSGMRDTIVYDLLEEAGLPSLQSAPYEVWLDYGEGVELLGLYTVVEVVDDTGVSANFGGDDGNIYEGDGPGATLATAQVDRLEIDFQKKNNEDDADWSDIHALFDALHDEKRTSDPAAWRADLEKVFAVDGFLAWLGIRAIVGHGDVFLGENSAHNFYLYNNPESGQLTWISWDHNFTFNNDFVKRVSLDKPSETDGPLVNAVLGDPVYFARYKQLLAENFAGAASPDAIIAKVRTYAALIAPYAQEQMSAEEYDAALQEIVDFVTSRATVIEDFLVESK